MLVWAIGTIACLYGVFNIMAIMLSGNVSEGALVSFPMYIALFFGGLIAVVINELVFGSRKEQLEIDRDEVIKTVRDQQSPTILAICPLCKNRISSNSKFCPECGADLQPTKS
jgi:hypothetical protein